MSAQDSKQKKQKWIKRWEPHKHCSVCGIATDTVKEFCSNKCSGEYFDWKKGKEKKEKRTWILMIVFIVVMVVILIVMNMISFA